jgi:hypothetical protein
MAKQASRRTFGALEGRRSLRTEKVTSWRAKYIGPDAGRHERPFVDKMAAEAWLNDERILIDRNEWTPPKVREALARTRSLQAITLRGWAERSMARLRAVARSADFARPRSKCSYWVIVRVPSGWVYREGVPVHDAARGPGRDGHNQ